jgi:ParB family chromosome partitioning protein
VVERRGGLGRGLSALIPSDPNGDGPLPGVREVPISQIEPNRYQPRDHFDEESLAGLTASIRELGVLQPVLVRQIGAANYELVAGERRWRAAKRAGLQFIPVVIRDITDELSLQHALVENLHRENLNPLEEAAGYQQLIEDFKLTQ